jgi:hypothetical protein
MQVKSITIEAIDGEVEIARTDHGALVTFGDQVLCEVRRDESQEQRFKKAYEVARTVYGEERKRLGRRQTGELIPNATNSMIHDVFNEIERVAGC